MGAQRIIIVVLVFLAMEPVAYLAHRYLMHGVGWVLHASHHRTRTTRLEANDAFPVIFAAFAITAFAIGTAQRTSVLVLTAIGVTAYGAIYAFVHDIYIHQRLGKLPKIELLEKLKRAHRLHHLFNGEPYGMLFPVVPTKVKRRYDALVSSMKADFGEDLELLENWDLGSRSKYVIVE